VGDGAVIHRCAPVSPDETLIRVSGHLACAAASTRFVPQ